MTVFLSELEKLTLCEQTHEVLNVWKMWCPFGSRLCTNNRHPPFRQYVFLFSLPTINLTVVATSFSCLSALGWGKSGKTSCLQVATT